MSSGSSSGTSPNFTSIYFDTNILVGHPWPRTSAALERILSLCKSLKVAVFIPQVVEIELENRWVRDYESSCDGVRSSLRDYRKYHQILEVQTASPELVESSKALAAYRDRVEHLKKHWSIGVVPTPSIPLVNLLQMASRREVAFEDKGAGFQDSLVFLSVLEQMRGSNATGELVSNDGIFDRRRVELAQLAGETGCQIVFFRSTDEIGQALELRESAKIQELIKKDEERALHTLQAEIDNLRSWLTDELDGLQLRGSQGWSSDVFQVSRVNSFRLVSVKTPFPLDRNEGQSVSITITIAGDAQVFMVDSPASRFAKSILSGRAFGRYEVTEQSNAGRRPAGVYTLTDYRVTRPVEIEIDASAVFRNGRYENLVFHSAKLLKISGPSLAGGSAPLSSAD